jgi:rare lipoprotein A
MSTQFAWASDDYVQHSGRETWDGAASTAWDGRVLSLSGGKLSSWSKWLGITVMCASMASCATTTAQAPKKKGHGKEYFSEKEYGVKASPRVVEDGRPVPKGGGRFMVGQPYEVKGKTYVPKEDPNYNKSGLASWYGSAFHGRLTANGEVYDSSHLSAAHPTFPLPSYARVTNLDTGSSVIVRVNDRGPYHEGRIIDVSGKTAELLDMKRTGTAKVNVQYVGRAKMDGQDMPFLMASYVRKGDRIPSIRPEGQIASGVMVASNQSLGDQLQSYGSSLPMPVKPQAERPAAAKRVAAGQRFDQPFEQRAELPSAVPVPGERAGTALAQSRQRAVASAAAAPKAERSQPRVQPVEQRMAAAAQPRVQEPVRARPTAETAYAAAPSEKMPKVMFGNMLLEPPKAGQKPAY